MIVRLWKTELDTARKNDYRTFEETRSLQMFREQAGFLGVLFLRSDEGVAGALTFWEDADAVARLRESPTYAATVEVLQSSNLLRGSQSVEVFDVVGEHLDGSLLIDHA